MKALVLTPANRQVQLRNDWPKPTPGPGEVLIEVHAVALNPIDEIYVSHPIATQDHRVIGTDFAGVVVDASPDLLSSGDLRARAGTRVAGFHQGACSTNDRPGAFSEYVTCPFDLLWVLPPDVTFEAGAAVSMCGLTAAQGVFARLGLPCPWEPQLPPSVARVNAALKPIYVFIYGASTSLGMYAAQLVQHASQPAGPAIRLIGAASSSQHERLRQAPYGYDFLVDYRHDAWADEVAAFTEGQGVDFALDCISEGETVGKTESLLNSDGRLAVFRGPVGGKYDTSKLRKRPIYGAVWEGLGVEIGYNNGTISASPAAREFAVGFYNYLSSAAKAEELRLHPNPLRLMPGGFERIVPDGLALLGEGGGMVSQRGSQERAEEHMRPVRGEKLVYIVA